MAKSTASATPSKTPTKRKAAAAASPAASDATPRRRAAKKAAPAAASPLPAPAPAASSPLAPLPAGHPPIPAEYAELAAESGGKCPFGFVASASVSLGSAALSAARRADAHGILSSARLASPALAIAAVCLAPCLVALGSMQRAASPFATPLLYVAALAACAFAATAVLIPPIAELNKAADLFGIDINKRGLNANDDKNPIKMCAGGGGRAQIHTNSHFAFFFNDNITLVLIVKPFNRPLQYTQRLAVFLPSICLLPHPSPHLTLRSPEAVGIVPGTVFIICLTLLQLVHASTPTHLVEYTAALSTITFIVFLGFADDVLNLRYARARDNFWVYRFHLVSRFFSRLPNDEFALFWMCGCMCFCHFPSSSTRPSLSAGATSCCCRRSRRCRCCWPMPARRR